MEALQARTKQSFNFKTYEIPFLMIHWHALQQNSLDRGDSSKICFHAPLGRNKNYLDTIELWVIYPNERKSLMELVELLWSKISNNQKGNKWFKLLDLWKHLRLYHLSAAATFEADLKWMCYWSTLRPPIEITSMLGFIWYEARLFARHPPLKTFILLNLLSKPFNSEVN